MTANPAKPGLALYQNLPNLFRNPIKPNLAFHQTLSEPSPEIYPIF